MLEREILGHNAEANGIGNAGLTLARSCSRSIVYDSRAQWEKGGRIALRTKTGSSICN